MKKTIKAWTVVFGRSKYASGEITYWSKDLHPIFTQKSFATNWKNELKTTGGVAAEVVPVIISYQFPTKRK